MAVLPLENLSPNPGDAYFAVGIREELIHCLGNLGGVSVIARPTVALYAESGKSVSEIGSELGVGTVITGCVRYAGRRVSITVQVIDAASGSRLWSEAFDEKLEDLFGIQPTIAARRNARLAEERSPSVCELEVIAQAYGGIDDVGEAARIFALADPDRTSPVVDRESRFWMCTWRQGTSGRQSAVSTRRSRPIFRS